MSDAARVKLSGRLIGRRVVGGRVVAMIVHSLRDAEPHGPAENAFVYVDSSSRSLRARYVSWINLYDIEHAATREPGWELLTPPRPFARAAEWNPYGWGGPAAPSVADPS